MTDGLFISRAIVARLAEQVLVAARHVSDGAGLVAMMPPPVYATIEQKVLDLLASGMAVDPERPGHWTLRIREDCTEAAPPCDHLATMERMWLRLP